MERKLKKTQYCNEYSDESSCKEALGGTCEWNTVVRKCFHKSRQALLESIINASNCGLAKKFQPSPSKKNSNLKNLKNTEKEFNNCNNNDSNNNNCNIKKDAVNEYLNGLKTQTFGKDGRGGDRSWIDYISAFDEGCGFIVRLVVLLGKLILNLPKDGIKILGILYTIIFDFIQTVNDNKDDIITFVNRVKNIFIFLIKVIFTLGDGGIRILVILLDLIFLICIHILLPLIGRVTDITTHIVDFIFDILNSIAGKFTDDNVPPPPRFRQHASRFIELLLDAGQTMEEIQKRAPWWFRGAEFEHQLRWQGKRGGKSRRKRRGRKSRRKRRTRHRRRTRRRRRKRKTRRKKRKR